jgi:hypothetical protein
MVLRSFFEENFKFYFECVSEGAKIESNLNSLTHFWEIFKCVKLSDTYLWKLS